MLNEARERHRLELAWQMGFHQAYEEINTGILDTTWAQQYLDVDTILKKYK